MCAHYELGRQVGDVGFDGSYLARRSMAAENWLAKTCSPGHDNGLALSQIVGDGVDPSGQPEMFWRMLPKLAQLRSKLSKRMDERTKPLRR